MPAAAPRPPTSARPTPTPTPRAHLLHAAGRDGRARLAQVLVPVCKGAAGALVAVPRLHVLDAQPRLVKGLVPPARAAAVHAGARAGGGGVVAAAAVPSLAAACALAPSFLQLLLGFQLRHDLRRDVPQLVLPVRIPGAPGTRTGIGTEGGGGWAGAMAAPAGRLLGRFPGRVHPAAAACGRRCTGAALTCTYRHRGTPPRATCGKRSGQEHRLQRASCAAHRPAAARQCCPLSVGPTGTASWLLPATLAHPEPPPTPTCCRCAS